jgi:hypothetical protein
MVLEFNLTKGRNHEKEWQEFARQGDLLLLIRNIRDYSKKMTKFEKQSMKPDVELGRVHSYNTQTEEIKPFMYSIGTKQHHAHLGYQLMGLQGLRYLDNCGPPTEEEVISYRQDNPSTDLTNEAICNRLHYKSVLQAAAVRYPHRSERHSRMVNAFMLKQNAILIRHRSIIFFNRELYSFSINLKVVGTSLSINGTFQKFFIRYLICL